MKIINKTFRILVILIFLFLSIINLCSCKVNSVDNEYIEAKKVPSDYSIDKAIEVNSFDNLTKETGYYKFYLRPVEKVLNSCIVYAHDKYLIFRLRNENLSIITDKSSAYIIKDDVVKEHRELYNYNQNSFLIDKSLHDTSLETTTVEDKIFDKYLASSKNCKEKLKYLNNNFPEIFNFDIDNIEGLFLYYFLYDNSYELFGYNVLATTKDMGSEVIYLVNNTTKEIDEEEKNYISNLIKNINNYKE